MSAFDDYEIVPPRRSVIYDNIYINPLTNVTLTLTDEEIQNNFQINTEAINSEENFKIEFLSDSIGLKSEIAEVKEEIQIFKQLLKKLKGRKSV